MTQLIFSSADVYASLELCLVGDRVYAGNGVRAEILEIACWLISCIAVIVSSWKVHTEILEIDTAGNWIFAY